MIGVDGFVGEIGGIDKKIIVVKNVGVMIFFVFYVKLIKEILKYEEGYKINY